MKKKYLIGIVIILVAAVMLLPFPQRINRAYDGVMYPVDAPDSAEACSIQLDGTCYRYLLREDEYVGKFIISALPYTTEPYDLVAGAETNDLNFLAHLTDSGYRTTGYYITPDGFGSMYVSLNGADDRKYHLVVPAADAGAAEAYIARLASQREFPLP